jgi:hypothetical protein
MHFNSHTITVAAVVDRRCQADSTTVIQQIVENGRIAVETAVTVHISSRNGNNIITKRFDNHAVDYECLMVVILPLSMF